MYVCMKDEDLLDLLSALAKMSGGCMKGEIVYQVLLSFWTNIIRFDEKRDIMV